MAATIEGAFVLIDKATDTMKKMERQAVKTMAAIEGVGAAQDVQTKRGQTASRALGQQSAGMKTFEQDLRSSRKGMDDFGKSTEQQTKRLSTLERAIKSLRGEFEKLRGSSSGGPGLGGLKAIERDLKTAKGALSDFAGSFGVIGKALMAFKFPAIGVGIGMLVQSLTALAGAALGTLPSFAALGSGMLGIPAAAAAAAQGLSVVKLAMSGVMQAAQAGMQAQNQWGLNSREFQQQVTSAMDAVISAHQGLTEAIYNQQQAQIQLTVARRDAVRQLQDMEFAAQTSVLKEARAGLDIQQAKMELQQAMMTPGTTQLQLQSLRLGVLEATSSARQTRVDAQRSRQDYGRARRGDPTSAPVMAVAQARHAQAQSVLEVGNAVRALNRAETALNMTTMQGNAGVSAYKRQLMGLQPIQRQFVRFLVGKMGPGDKGSLMGQFQQLQQSAGEGLFPQLEKAVRTLSGGFGMLDNAARKTGGVMGGMANKVVDAFFGKKGIAQTNQILHTNVTVLGHVSGAVGYFADMLRRLMVAAGPTLIWLSKMVENWFKLHDATMATAAGQDALRTKFEHFRTVLHELGTVMHNVWTIFHNINKAAWDFNQTMWHGSESATKRWADITGSPEGQKRLHDWFEGLLPLLRALGKLVEGLGKGLVGLTSPGANQGTAGLVSGLTKLIPSLQRIILGLESAFGPPIISALQQIGKVAGDLVGNGGPFALFLKFLTQIIKAFDWLLKLPGVGRGLTVFLASLFAVNFAANYVSKITGMIAKVSLLRTRWTEVGKAQKIAAEEGMASPGTRRGGFFSRLLGLGGSGGGVSGAVQASTSWGIKSGDGPGSVLNPLMVRVEGGLGGGGAPGVKSAEKTAAGDVTAGLEGAGGAAALSRTEKLGAWLAGKGSFGAKAASGLGKLPLLGGLARGAEAAAGGTAAVDSLGILSKLGTAGKVLGKIALPIAAITTAIPAISAFISTQGNVLDKLGAAGSAAVNSLTFGLVNLTSPTRRHQVQQGHTRATATLSQFDQAGGTLTPHGLAQLRGRASQLTRQFDFAAHGTTTPGRWGQGRMVVGQDTAVRQDRFAQLTGIAAGFVHQVQALHGNLAELTPKELDALRQTGRQLAADPALAKYSRELDAVVEKLNDPDRGLQGALKKVVPTFDYMRQGAGKSLDAIKLMTNFAVQDIQSTLPAGSAAATSALAQNYQIAAEDVDTSMKKGVISTQQGLDQINKLMAKAFQALGINPQTAMKLAKQGWNVGQVQSGMRSIASSGLGATTSTGSLAVNATGGRIMGSNPRDVYQIGGNMVGGGELVMNKWQEADANARLMRHGEPTVGTMVSNRNTPHWYAGGGRLSSFTGGPANLYGHPANIHPGVRQAIAAMEHFWPGMQVTATTDGSHVPNSYHYRGEAVDMASGDYGYMNRAAEWIKTSGMYRSLVEGIHNPNLAISNGQIESPPGIFGGVWAGHANHIHMALTGALGQIAASSVNGATGGTAGGRASRSIPHIKAPNLNAPGMQGVYAQTLIDGYTRAVNRYVHEAAGGGAGGTGGFGGIRGVGGSSSANMALGRRMMLRYWGPDQWPALKALWTQESGWNANAVNPTSGAAGIPQALGHGTVFPLGQARPQIAWGLNYIKGRYGSPDAAEAHERSFNWYSGGGRMANWAGWHRDGGIFTTNGPTIFGAGEGGVPETVHIGPADSSTRPIHIEIHNIEVHRKGDVKKIVDEELALLAASLRGD